MLSSLCILLSLASIVGAEYAPVTELDLPSYTGRWYQVYKNRFDMTFQGMGTCAVADYNLVTSNVTVLNSQLDANGDVDQIKGFAFYQDGKSGGELTVSLDGTPRPAPYWVLELGPVVNNKYDYSIVSDNNRISLFVLTRNVERFYEKYDADVKKSMMRLGFTNPINQPVVMSQDDCDYDKYNTRYQTNRQSECQVAGYLRHAGFSESTVPTMVCISKYESSFNCDATNKNVDGSTDYGLFEINSYYWCSGDPTSKYNECGTTCQSLFDCQKNTNCAYRVWKEQGFNAWYGYQYHKSECDNYKINC